MSNKPMIKRIIQVKVTPTPQELAEAFWELNSFEQVLFLERLANISKDKLVWQLEAITSENTLSEEVRYVMSKFGEYSNHHNKENQ